MSTRSKLFAFLLLLVAIPATPDQASACFTGGPIDSCGDFFILYYGDCLNDFEQGTQGWDMCIENVLAVVDVCLFDNCWPTPE